MMKPNFFSRKTLGYNNDDLVKQQIPFSQLFKLSSYLSGFKCFAYSIVFLNFVNWCNQFKPNQKIDYSALLSLLNNYNQQDLSEIQGLQEKYRYSRQINHVLLLNNEVSHLTQNSDGSSDEFRVFTNMLLNKLNHYTKSSLYFFHYWDRTQFILGNLLAHTVVFYAASPNELHFFDSNSGVYILEIPSDLTEDNFESIIQELLFKNNLLFDCLTDYKKGSFEYKYQIIENPEEFSLEQCNIFNKLSAYAENKNEIIPASHFFNINRFIIDTQREINSKKTLLPNNLSVNLLLIFIPLFLTIILMFANEAPKSSAGNLFRL